MAKKELVSFCKPEETPPFGGTIHFKNPRYFYEYESIPAYCSHFFAKDERVRKAYLAAGKIEHGKESNCVQQEEKEGVSADPEDNSSEDEETPFPSDGTLFDADIDNMSWPQLRAYAATLTDEPIKNKKVALEVIERLG